MPLHRKLLQILRCPVTKQSLSYLSEQKLNDLNTQITDRTVRYSDGTFVEDTLDEALITDNGSFIYRIDSNIPVMLQDRSIPSTEIKTA